MCREQDWQQESWTWNKACTRPVELEKLFVVVEHPLPDRSQLREIAGGIATEEGELPEETELDAMLDASAALRRHEAENAFSLSLVRHHWLTVRTRL